MRKPHALYNCKHLKQVREKSVVHPDEDVFVDDSHQQSMNDNNAEETPKQPKNS